jgi:hypothetical protein
MANGFYLAVIIGLYVMFISLTVLMSIVGQPAAIMEKLNQHAEFLFTYKGRFVVDVFLALFLFGMGAFGVAMAVIHLILIVGIRLLAATFPGAFEELFRAQGEGGGHQNFDSPYGSDPAGFNQQPAAGFAPQPSADL